LGRERERERDIEREKPLGRKVAYIRGKENATAIHQIHQKKSKGLYVLHASPPKKTPHEKDNIKMGNSSNKVIKHSAPSSAYFDIEREIIKEEIKRGKKEQKHRPS